MPTKMDVPMGLARTATEAQMSHASLGRCAGSAARGHAASGAANRALPAGHIVLDALQGLSPWLEHVKCGRSVRPGGHGAGSPSARSRVCRRSR
jgi:hypothetical protein